MKSFLLWRLRLQTSAKGNPPFGNPHLFEKSYKYKIKVLLSYFSFKKSEKFFCILLLKKSMRYGFSESVIRYVTVTCALTAMLLLSKATPTSWSSPGASTAETMVSIVTLPAAAIALAF